jgi:uncharacterized protein (TIGR03067 family)
MSRKVEPAFQRRPKSIRITGPCIMRISCMDLIEQFLFGLLSLEKTDKSAPMIPYLSVHEDGKQIAWNDSATRCEKMPPISFGGRGRLVLEVTMKGRLLMIAALGLLLGAASPQDPASAEDLEGLHGTWKLVSATQDGKALPDDKVKKTTIVFKHDAFQFPELAEYATSRSGTIKLDATKAPKHMDAISTKGGVMLGIYELNGAS